MVRLAGIEPTTPWFVAKYSIQLSYSREALHYSMARWIKLERAGRFSISVRQRLCIGAQKNSPETCVSELCF